MEAELKRDIAGISVALIEGRGGVFDVIADGKVVFSKDSGNCGSRFPHEGEITDLLIGSGNS